MNFIEYINEDEDSSLGILGIKELRDGLTLAEIQKNDKFHWVILAGISDAVLGKKGNKIVWYSGEWTFGEWISNHAIWKSGKWLGGYDEKGSVHKRGDSPDKW